MSVVLHAPAVFQFTAQSNPARHLQVAKLMGAKIDTNTRDEDAGRILSDQLVRFMQRLKIPNGYPLFYFKSFAYQNKNRLVDLGFKEADIPTLVKGTLPQHRVLKLSPRPTGEEELHHLFQHSMKIW